MLDQSGIDGSRIKRKTVIAVTMATSRQGLGVVKELCKTNKSNYFGDLIITNLYD